MREIIKEFKEKCEEWSKLTDENIVYNKDLDQLEAKNVKLILVADNPGQIEAEHKRYLIGPAGISARVYFEKAFVTDFKKEVLVLNKTPLHTNTTEKLNSNKLLIETQIYMAEMISKLHQKLEVPVFIMGTSGGLKKYTDKGKFGFKAPLKEFFMTFFTNVKSGEIKDYEVFGHFSRNMFYAYCKVEDYENGSKEILFEQSKLIKEFIKNTIK